MIWIPLIIFLACLCLPQFIRLVGSLKQSSGEIQKSANNPSNDSSKISRFVVKNKWLLFALYALFLFGSMLWFLFEIISKLYTDNSVPIFLIIFMVIVFSCIYGVPIFFIKKSKYWKNAEIFLKNNIRPEYNSSEKDKIKWENKLYDQMAYNPEYQKYLGKLIGIICISVIIILLFVLFLFVLIMK
jgi:hypothetical protein